LTFWTLLKFSDIFFVYKINPLLFFFNFNYSINFITLSKLKKTTIVESLSFIIISEHYIVFKFVYLYITFQKIILEKTSPPKLVHKSGCMA
jgi:hypothetical protein